MIIFAAFEVPLPSPESFIDEYFVEFLTPALTEFFKFFAGATIIKLLIFRK